MADPVFVGIDVSADSLDVAIEVGGTKFAVEGLSRSVAAELAESNIRVNTVAPGPIATDMADRISQGDPSGFAEMVPMKRLGTPEEIAQTVVFLASDASSFMTGSVIAVDGGHLVGSL